MNLQFPAATGHKAGHFLMRYLLSNHFTTSRVWQQNTPTIGVGHTKITSNVLGLSLNLYKFKQTCPAGYAESLTNLTPPIGQIHPFRKIAKTIDPIMGF